jgi:glutathione peroxidase
MATIYDFSVKTVEGGTESLEKYRGKVLLVVNTATKCGLTPQYDALQALYEKYKERGFEILDFPCNQFKEQAPGSDEEIGAFCTGTYGITFPRYSKIEVNGNGADPLYKWLKETLPDDIADVKAKAFAAMVKPLTPGNGPADIKWNFCKFLIDKNGTPVKRFSPAMEPKKLDKEVAATLQA